MQKIAMQATAGRMSGTLGVRQMRQVRPRLPGCLLDNANNADQCVEAVKRNHAQVEKRFYQL